MSPESWLDKETHRARALADALSAVRQRLNELEDLQAAMAAAGCTPQHVLREDGRRHLEELLVYHNKSLQWRLRHPGASQHHAGVQQAKARSWRKYYEAG